MAIDHLKKPSLFYPDGPRQKEAVPGPTRLTDDDALREMAGGASSFRSIDIARHIGSRDRSQSAVWREAANDEIEPVTRPKIADQVANLTSSGRVSKAISDQASL